MEGDLVHQYYVEIPRLRYRTHKHLKRIVEFYAMKNPGADVLEIGAGTGGAKQTVLEAFGCRGDASGSLPGHFTLTDVSAGFFDAASQKLAPWTSMMDFAKLNIELDPVEQSFAANSNDLIVASMVLHATESLHKTMSHVRKPLKPGGKVLLVEITKDRLDIQLIFHNLSRLVVESRDVPKAQSERIFEDLGGRIESDRFYRSRFSRRRLRAN